MPWSGLAFSYQDNVLAVPKRLRDAFVFKALELLTGTMCQYGGDRGHLPLLDCTRWIETQFLTTEARLLLAALSAA